MNRVYLPIRPLLKILTCRTTPARSERSKRRNGITPTVALCFLLVEAAMRLSDAVGHPRPRQVTVTRAPTGACALSTLSLTPEDVTMPAMRTIGKGCISSSGGGGGRGGAAA